jgi:predicted phosphodiesterase
MRIAVISDIHSNLQALDAVLADVKPREPEEIWCLGDIVGYGADPDACTSLVAGVAVVCLAGNHDLVVRGDIGMETFAMAAGAAARWTARVITKETRHFLDGLLPLGQNDGVGLYHGSPRDPVWEYVLSAQQARDCLDIQSQRVCLIGHSHVACHFSRRNGAMEALLAEGGATIDLAEGEWLVNPGSVGQPRDGDPRAAYMMLDTGAWNATFHRVDYDIEAAGGAILEAGLPAQLAERLYEGH